MDHEALKAGYEQLAERWFGFLTPSQQNRIQAQPERHRRNLNLPGVTTDNRTVVGKAKAKAKRDAFPYGPPKLYYRVVLHFGDEGVETQLKVSNQPTIRNLTARIVASVRRTSRQLIRIVWKT